MVEYSIYKLFLDNREKEITEGREFVTDLRDLADFRRVVARVRVARSLDQLPGAEKLWVRTYNEDLLPEPLAVQVLEELSDDDVSVGFDAGRGTCHTVGKTV